MLTPCCFYKVICIVRAHQFFHTSLQNLGSGGGKKFFEKFQMVALKNKNKYIAPQHLSNTCQLVPFSTHFSFGWKKKFKPVDKTVESLQSHFIHTMSHWSSGLPNCFPSWGTWVPFPGGYLCETGILLLALSRYIGNPNMIWSLALSPFSGCFTRLRANNV